MAERARRSSANSTALWVLAVIATLFFLRAAKSLLIPIAVAVLISYALEPAVAWLQRRHVHRIAGSALVLLLTVGVAAAAGYALRDDVTQVAAAVPDAMEKARELAADKLGQLGAGGSSTGQQGATEGAVGTAGNSASGGGGSLLQRGAAAVFAFAGHLVVVFFLTFFLLMSGHHLRNRMVEAAGDDRRQRIVGTIITEINSQIQRYLLVLLFTAVIVGIATWVVLAIMGVEHAMMWGAFAGVFNSIPYFGPVIVSGGLFAVGLVQGGGMTQALQMAGAAIVITSLEGWLLTPPLMGKAERMNAVTVFLGLLLWTWLWGGWGTILAVPMLVVLKSVADHVEGLRPVGRLMAP